MNTPELAISSEADDMDVAMIHAFLTTTYWATGRTQEQVATSIRHSQPYGFFLDKKQIAFARVLSDKVAFAYVLDVFVLPSFRRQGYATRLLEHILNDRSFADVRVWLLKTRDAHEFYSRLGFTTLPAPDDFMRLFRQQPVEFGKKE